MERLVLGSAEAPGPLQWSATLTVRGESAAIGGAAGIVMECVDPGNYPAADCEVIRNFNPTACTNGQE